MQVAEVISLNRRGHVAAVCGGQSADDAATAGDVARAAAELLHDTSHPAAPFYRLIGAVPTIAEIVAEFGDALGTPLRYVNAAPDKWREDALRRGGTEHAVEHLSRLWQVVSKSANRPGVTYEITEAIEQITGSKPETLRQFLQANSDDLRKAPERTIR